MVKSNVMNSEQFLELKTQYFVLLKKANMITSQF